MKDVCMAVLANKSDLPGAMTSKEVADGLGLMNIRNRKWYIQSTCANTGEGIYEALDWISKTLA